MPSLKRGKIGKAQAPAPTTTLESFAVVLTPISSRSSTSRDPSETKETPRRAPKMNFGRVSGLETEAESEVEVDLAAEASAPVPDPPTPPKRLTRTRSKNTTPAPAAPKRDATPPSDARKSGGATSNRSGHRGRPRRTPLTPMQVVDYSAEVWEGRDLPDCCRNTFPEQTAASWTFVRHFNAKHRSRCGRCDRDVAKEARWDHFRLRHVLEWRLKAWGGAGGPPPLGLAEGSPLLHALLLCQEPPWSPALLSAVEGHAVDCRTEAVVTLDLFGMAGPLTRSRSICDLRWAADVPPHPFHFLMQRPWNYDPSIMSPVKKTAGQSDSEAIEAWNTGAIHDPAVRKILGTWFVNDKIWKMEHEREQSDSGGSLKESKKKSSPVQFFASPKKKRAKKELFPPTCGNGDH